MSSSLADRSTLEDLVLVTAPDGNLELRRKTDEKRPALPRAPRISRAIGRNTKPLRTRLVQDFTFTTTTATNYTGSTAIQPSNAFGFTNFQGVYNQLRVNSVHLQFYFTSSATSLVQKCGVVSYDPGEATSLTALAEGANYQDHLLFALPTTTAAGNGVPAILSKDGFLHFRFKVPKGIALMNNLLVVDGAWTETTGAFQYGNLQWFLESQTPTVTVRGFIHYNLEFRYRE